MRKISVFLLVVIFFLTTTISAVPQTLVSQEGALEDARYLREKLEQIHPNLYFATSKEDTEERFRVVLEKLKSKNTWSKLGLYRVLAPFVASFKDGHTSLSIYDEFREFTDRGGSIFPLLVRVEDGSIEVVANLLKSEPGSGRRILSINGIPAETLYEELTDLVGAARKPFVESKVSSNFPIYLWARFELEKPYDITFVTESGTEKSIKLEGISAERYREMKDSIMGKSELNWDLTFPRKGFGLLTINTFRGDLKQEFREFVKDSFREIHRREPEYLAIDLRNNGGGSTVLSDFLYGFVSAVPFRTFAEVRVKYSKPVMEKTTIFNPITLFRVTVLGDRTIVHKNDYSPPPERKHRFTGKLFVLTGPGTFSTAADFAATIKDVGAGKIVGEETGGLASSYGDVFSLELPNSGLDLGVSYKYFLRTGGFDNGRGVVPDIEIETDRVERVEGADPVLSGLLEKIGGETGG